MFSWTSTQTLNCFVNSRLGESDHLKPIFWNFCMIYGTVEIYEYQFMMYDMVYDT